MKNVFYLFAIGSMLQTQLAFAQTSNQLCQQAYSQTISTCSIGLSSLPASARSGAQKGCVDQATATKGACSVGSNSCLTNCEAADAAAIATCNSTYKLAALIRHAKRLSYNSSPIAPLTRPISSTSANRPALLFRDYLIQS